TEMADLNTPVEVIAKLLHQRDRTVTKYYSRPTPTKVMSAAEMIFVDRIDVGAEGLRSPDEIGRMLKDAEGKVGALTEVFGGTCVVANMCPAKLQKDGSQVTYASVCKRVNILFGLTISPNTIKRNEFAYRIYLANRRPPRRTRL